MTPTEALEHIISYSLETKRLCNRCKFEDPTEAKVRVLMNQRLGQLKYLVGFLDTKMPPTQ